MKLISMTNFVLEQKENNKIDLQQRFINSYNYANFLKQPLDLGMFVTCDEHTKLEKVLFCNFKYSINTIKEIIDSSKIIEDLITCSKLDFILTENALKQIGL